MRRGEAAGLGRGPGGQRLVGAGDVAAGWGHRALADGLVDVLHRLEHSFPVAPARSSQTQAEVGLRALFCKRRFGWVTFFCFEYGRS